MMTNRDLELLLKYPLLTCKIFQRTETLENKYIGYVSCGNHDVNLCIKESLHSDTTCTIENFGDETSLNISEEDETCPPYSSVIGITPLIDRLVQYSKKKFKTVLQSRNIYKLILQEYTEFNRFHVNVGRCNISEDFSQIRAMILDTAGREHSLLFLIDFNRSKDIFIPLLINLPEQVTKEFPKSVSSLCEVYLKYTVVLEMLQPFFDVMDDLDRTCTVLDPEHPTRRDCYRRIWLAENLSVLIIIDPINVKVQPELKFLGSDHIVDQYVHQTSKKIENWDERMNFLQGLLNLLELQQFPIRPKIITEVLMTRGECSICYTLRLSDKLPEVICDNQLCKNSYHVECLYQWLTSLNCKRIFNQIFGQCPNCEQNITCPLLETE